jgi:hypothetical protein
LVVATDVSYFISPLDRSALDEIVNRPAALHQFEKMLLNH